MAHKEPSEASASASASSSRPLGSHTLPWDVEEDRDVDIQVIESDQQSLLHQRVLGGGLVHPAALQTRDFSGQNQFGKHASLSYFTEDLITKSEVPEKVVFIAANSIGNADGGIASESLHLRDLTSSPVDNSTEQPLALSSSNPCTEQGYADSEPAGQKQNKEILSHIQKSCSSDVSLIERGTVNDTIRHTSEDTEPQRPSSQHAELAQQTYSHLRPDPVKQLLTTQEKVAHSRQSPTFAEQECWEAVNVAEGHKGGFKTETESIKSPLESNQDSFASPGESGPPKERVKEEIAGLPEDFDDFDFGLEIPEGVPTNMFIDVNEHMFVGRKKEFDKLAASLQKDRIAGVSGMGGVGKTTFVSLYAYKNVKFYQNGIFFVDASNINTLPFNFAQLAGPDMLNLVPRPEEDITTSMRLVTNWLHTHSEYLLLYDAADDEATLQELGKQRIHGYRYIPSHHEMGGDIIITSRCPPEKFDAVQIMSPLLLEDLSTQDACDFLLKRVYYGEKAPDFRELSLVQTLVTEFLPGLLPLHLEQTASHIRGENLTFGDYLQDVRRQKERNPVGAAGFGDNRKTVDDAFSANFDAVLKSSPGAACLLNMAAVCHTRDIPLALFSVGTLGLSLAEEKLETETSSLIEFLTEEMTAAKAGDNWEEDFFKKASVAGERPLRQLLSFPRQSQLVKISRGSGSFSVHEVIQEQLRLRMKGRGELFATLQNLGTILLYLLRSDDASLANKRMFLSHADACTRHMTVFGLPVDAGQRESYFQLFMRLRMRTAYVFSWLGSFTTAWEIITDLDKKVTSATPDQLQAELYGLKARICVWQHRPKEAHEFGLKGLEKLNFGKGLELTATREVMEYALLRKSCAHALVSLHDTEREEVHSHMAEAKALLKHIMNTTKVKCHEEYGQLLMLYGWLHRNNGYRNQDDTVYHRKELTAALRWFTAAVSVLNSYNTLITICKIHQCLTELKLDLKGHAEGIAELVACRDVLEQKLGRYHRYTAWVMEKTASVMMESDRAEEALALIRESLTIQRQVYSMEDGKLQRGGTMLYEAKALLQLKHVADAVRTLEAAEKLIEHTPKHPALMEVRQLLTTARAEMNIHPNTQH